MTANIPTPRTVKPDFALVPRHWLGKSRIATHIANGVNLLFPAGERFFVRSVYRYLDQIKDPELLARVKGFAGQEGRHASAHETFFRALEEQGFELKQFLRVYQWLAYGVIERFSPPMLRLSTTVACEHFTAMLAEGVLRDGLLEQLADPALQELLLWHAAEEIEHKSVAFDVLQSINPSYAWRMGGLALATVCLGGFWIAATAALLRQDKKLGPEEASAIPVRELMKRRKLLRETFVSGIKQYMRRDFHPNQNDNCALAEKYLQRANLT
jgi:predicted metal-dependent hydrolase